MTAQPTRQAESAPAADGVFNALVTDIVSGRYESGSRLPAERDLARTMGASRPTLREALRRMSEWGLLEAKRGSGITIRHRRHWALVVLPYFLRHGGALRLRVVADMLVLRQTILVSLIRTIGDRLPEGGTDRALEVLQQAWEARDRPPEFAVLDIGIFKSLFEAADMLPALWILNSIESGYVDLAPTFGTAFQPPGDYIQMHEQLIGHIEKGDSKQAADLLDAYYERHDAGIKTLLAAIGA